MALDPTPTTIPGLPLATVVNPADLFVIHQDGTTKRAPGSLVGTGGGGTGGGGLPVGTTAGTVAAGNDSRIMGAQQRTLVIRPYTSAHTLVAADAVDSLVEVNSALSVTLTIPANSQVPFPVGCDIPISSIGAGTTNVVAGSGVTLVPAGLVLDQYSSGTLYQRLTNVWVFLAGASSALNVSGSPVAGQAAQWVNGSTITGVNTPPPPGTATTSVAGLVRPDGTSITINGGVISAPGGGGGGSGAVVALASVTQLAPGNTTPHDFLTMTVPAGLLAAGLSIEGQFYGTQSNSADGENLTFYAKINGGPQITLAVVGAGTIINSYRSMSGRMLLVLLTTGAGATYTLGGDMTISGLKAFSQNSGSARSVDASTQLQVTLGIQRDNANAANFEMITAAILRR